MTQNRSRQLDITSPTSPRPLLLSIPPTKQDRVRMDSHGAYQPAKRLPERHTRHTQGRVLKTRLPEMGGRREQDVLRHTGHRPEQSQAGAFGDGERRHGLLSPASHSRLRR